MFKLEQSVKNVILQTTITRKLLISEILFKPSFLKQLNKCLDLKRNKLNEIQEL